MTRRRLTFSAKAWIALVLSAIFFALDLWFWHRSILYVGAGLSTLLANFQVFIMMAAGAWLVVKGRPLSSSRTELTLYGAQLVFNGLWSWLFFRWQMGAAAFADVLILVLLVALTTRAFFRVKPAAGWLMLPYLAWVTFACALTYSMWQGNPGWL